MRAPTHVRSMLLALVLALPGVAGAGIEVELQDASLASDDISRRAVELANRAAPGRGFIPEATAIQRFQDYMFLHLIGDHEPAAEGFFALVTAGSLTDVGLHLDAEWYLAESLFGMGNLVTAEARFRVIAGDNRHPFREDAVLRLLEVYTVAGDDERFNDLFEREIVRGRVKTTDLITYTVAKSLYHRDDFAESRRYFGELEETSAFWGKAHFTLGAMLVAEGQLEPALAEFEAVVARSVETYEDRLVHDQALLAVGRIKYELGDYAAAAEAYDRISGESEYMADKLYELVWTKIRVEDHDAALRGIEIFLLAFPEHRYTAQLKLVEGHLHVAQVHYDSALGSYETVIADYAPVRDRFGDLARTEEEPDVYFQRVLDLDSEGAAGLPPFAVSMMMSDPELARAITVFRDLEKQVRDIEVSESIIRELREAMSALSGLGSFEQIRYDVVINQTKAIEQQLILLESEENWLRDNGVSEAILEPLRLRREALLGRTREQAFRVEEAERELVGYRAQVRALFKEAALIRAAADEQETDLVELTAELAGAVIDAETRDSVLSDLDYLARDLKEARFEIDDVDMRLSALKLPSAVKMLIPPDQTGDIATEIAALRAGYEPHRPDRVGQHSLRIDGIHSSLIASQLVLDGVLAKLGTLESSEFERIRARFEHEVTEVASQRVAYGETVSDAQAVSIGLTRAGFGRLEDFFADSVLKADMGIVDVYWAQKLETSDEITRVKERKAEFLADLERRFELIKQKMGE